MCELARVIPYFNMRDHLLVPPAHALARGVGLELWTYIFNPLLYKPKAPTFDRGKGKGKKTQKN